MHPWNDLTESRRLALAVTARFVIRKGTPSRTAKRIATQQWADLTPAVRNVLKRYFVWLDDDYTPRRPGDEAVVFAQQTGMNYSDALVYCNMD